MEGLTHSTTPLGDEEHFRSRSCGGKRRYSYKGEARASLRSMSQSNIHIYYCKFCGGFHIGHEMDNQLERSERLRRKKR